MAGYIKDASGTWKKFTPKIRVDNTGFVSDWKNLKTGWVKTSNGWKRWYAGVVPTPTFTVSSTTTTSATISISNYSASYTYSTPTTTAGTATRNAGTITVSGLTAGQQFTVSIIATLLGTNSAVGQITSSSTPATPTFGTAYNKTFTSFSIDISPATYNANYTYSVSVNPGSYTRNGAAISVTGLSGPGASATVSVTATTPQNISSAVGTATVTTNTLANPTISTSSPTLNGFTITVGNVTAGYTYYVTTNPALTVTLQSTSGTTSTYLASGGSPGTAYSVSVYATYQGYTTGTATANQSTAALVNPTLTLTPGVRSIGVLIGQYDATYTYTLTISPNVGTKSGSGDTWTYTGLTPSTFYTVSVVGQKSGFTTGTTNQSTTTLARWTVSPTSAYSATAYSGYTLVKFTAGATITYNEAINSVQYAIVGGGGAGGGSNQLTASYEVGAGGGGGATCSTGSINEPAGSKSVIIGAGGSVGSTGAASASQYGSLIGSGGNPANYFTGTFTTAGATGVSISGGGGGSSGVTRNSPLAGVAGAAAPGSLLYGSGGPGFYHTGYDAKNAGGGGGGASPAIAAAPPNTAQSSPNSLGADANGGGLGAVGTLLFNDSVLAIYVGGGGAGAGVTNRGVYYGGGGNGMSLTGSTASTSGQANTGGGGGGGANYISVTPNGSPGGSGVVYLKIPN